MENLGLLAFLYPDSPALDWVTVSVASVALYVLALAGIAYLALALNHVWRFRGEVKPADSANLPPVSIMKPLCGDEPGLYQCLRSFCQQDYPAYQVVFGVRDADDAAVKVVNRLRAEFPEREIALVTDARIYGANLKVSNLINMMPACRHDMLVIADSDVAVGPDALTRVMVQLTEDGVGATSCLYRGKPMEGLASRLGALYINDWFLPSVLVDVALSGVDGCFGALMAVRREALASVGGFHAMVNHLAEDNLLGRLLRRGGWQVRLSSYTVDTMVGEDSLSALIHHEVRWSRTVRACRPLDHFLSLTTFPLLLTVFLLAIDPSILGCFLAALHLLLRMGLHLAVARRFPHGASWNERMADVALVPLRECLCFVVWLVSLSGTRVRWRNRDYRIIGDGRLLMSESPELSLPTPISATIGE
jgi:ceramide glucosyltransferase